MFNNADDIDAACEIETASRERAIAAARAHLAGTGSADCANCGEAIPEARREALPSATRCIACQTKLERP